MEWGLKHCGKRSLPVRPRAGSPCHGKSRSAFTLIELLVVISIIALLMGITIPVVGRAVQNAKKAQARTEITTIESAVRAYFNEYGRFPHGSGLPDFQYIDNNVELMNVLRAIDAPGNVGHEQNRRRIAFLEISDASLDDGTFVDPWRSSYRVVIDTDFDNEVDTGTYGPVPNRMVAVWSLGPNAVEDAQSIKSWE